MTAALRTILRSTMAALIVQGLVGLAGCEQAPVPPPIRPDQNPEPFDPPDTHFVLDDEVEESSA